MTEKIQFSGKQKEYWNNANRRWNVKSGATRSGKTYMDYYMVPRRVRQADPTGEIVLLGHTQSTIERNVIEPMRRMWGHALVGNISSNNTINLFGRRAYVIGADKKNQVEKIQGMGISYAYGDEVTTWSENVFTMLKSRLDKPTSLFEGTCNPDNPNHWFKQFLDSNADIYHQHYSLYDNPFLADSFIENLEREYAGTVFYNRFILGEWTRAEGAIYKRFAGQPEKYFIEKENIPDLMEIIVGVDFGGNKSKHSFVATGISEGYKDVIALMSERHDTDVTPNELADLLVRFLDRVYKQFGAVSYVYPDSAEQVLIRGIKEAMLQAGYEDVIVRNSKKIQIVDRIRLVTALQSQERFWYTEDAKTVKVALEQAVWNEAKDKDERLDDGTSDIDTLDAFEYSIERDARRLIQ